MSAISGFCEKCNKFRKRHCDGNRNTCMSILFDTIEALQQENEQFKTSEKICEDCWNYALVQKDGRLVALPCKVGDTVYRLDGICSRDIEHIEIYGDEIIDEIIFVDDSDNIFRLDDIGKTVFLTREEAEKALEGSK